MYPGGTCTPGWEPLHQRVRSGIGQPQLRLGLRLGLRFIFTFTSFLPSLLHSHHALLLCCRCWWRIHKISDFKIHRRICCIATALLILPSPSNNFYELGTTYLQVFFLLDVTFRTCSFICMCLLFRIASLNRKGFSSLRSNLASTKKLCGRKSLTHFAKVRSVDSASIIAQVSASVLQVKVVRYLI